MKRILRGNNPRISRWDVVSKLAGGVTLSHGGAFTNASALTSDFETGAIHGIELSGMPGLTELRGEVAELAAKKRETIEAIRAGKHVELSMRATAFRQRKGKPNRRYVRLGGDIASQAKTFKGQPFLVDHATHSQASRKGIITSIEHVEESATSFSFLMGIHVVKPDAVISVLDGTLDRFSIGWFQRGPVLCSLHGCDVTSSDGCGCWPGDVVEEGGKKHTIELEFSAWEGKELSGVNIPAVVGTSIEEIRTALAAELGIKPRTKEKHMRFARLAAALGMSALEDGDEERALSAITTLQNRAVTAEEKLAKAVNALADEVAKGNQVRVDAILADAYRAGKLVYGRDQDGKRIPSGQETLLRHVASAKDGIAMLEAHIAAMPAVAVLGADGAQALRYANPERTVFAATGELQDPGLSAEQRKQVLLARNPHLQEVANQLGLKVEDMIAFHEGRTRTQQEG